MEPAPGAYRDCPFCLIACGKDPDAVIVAEGRTWVALFPLEPATPGHTLVIPRVHFADLWHVDDELASELVTAAIRVGRGIKRALGPEGLNLITSSGEAAEQTVFHLHLHVVPRWSDDRFGRIWPAAKRMSVGAKKSLADRIRKELTPSESR